MSEIVNKLCQLYDSTESEKTSMTEIIHKLIQIEARLSTLACFEGHTITEMLAEMLLDSCDMLNGMIDDLKEKEEAP